ncbi:hypothetical protein COU57_04090 [Candidatus Pacearchaeota archaeon CG10_big_fil_rev_8_21_14_0_10_32_14]|nr:MAG: hypothetical protein COU57_04090 [Candidatus Pacearchaeota archaeon CG10_big_fil_rev_8_21_14_0_10_32_14]
MKTKVVALDVYGTLIASDDYDNELPPRDGLAEFFKKCSSHGINVVTSSDVNIETMKRELGEAFSKRNLELSLFDNFFRITTFNQVNPENPLPKDYLPILMHYKIQPPELLVVGDNPYLDFTKAKEIGSQTLQVPKYIIKEDGFDFSSIELI